MKRFGAPAVFLALSLGACSPVIVGASEPEFYELPTLKMDSSINLVGGTDPTSVSVALSHARFASAPGVVVTPQEGLEEATATASKFGIPVLVLEENPTEAELNAVVTEAARLGVMTVLGDATHEDLAALVTENLGDNPAGQLTETTDPLPQVIAVVPDEATATSVGSVASDATIVVAPVIRDSAEAVAALAAAPAAAVLGFGNHDLQQFTWQVNTARTGVTLPGGADQSATQNRLYVALYGHPGSPVLGVLGEQGVEATIARAAEHAAAYAPYTDLNLVPTLELIATIADRPAGADGDYSAESRIELLRPFVDAAEVAGHYVLLDLQPGRTDFLTQAHLYEELLLKPHVGLALDPEWRLKPNQVHLQQIGSVPIDEVNTVISWLADFTREHNLPQKILVLHSFRTSMLPDIDNLDLTRPELAVTIHVDGQGGQEAKVNTWNVLQNYAPNVSHWGWKNFYDEDVPRMLTPEETLARVVPTPLLISYQ